MNVSLANYKSGWLLLVIWLLLTLLISAFDTNRVWGIVPPILILTITLYFYDKYAWRWPFFKGLVNIPDLSGEYRGALVTSSKDAKQPRINCRLTISQTASDIQVDCQFPKEGEEEDSFSQANSAIIQKRGGRFHLLVYYQSEGGVNSAEGGSLHFGFVDLLIREDAPKSILEELQRFFLETNKNVPIKLKGRYFTDRNTRGKLEVVKIINEEKTR